LFNDNETVAGRRPRVKRGFRTPQIMGDDARFHLTDPRQRLDTSKYLATITADLIR
jgi:hypothetical protein